MSEPKTAAGRDTRLFAWAKQHAILRDNGSTPSDLLDLLAEREAAAPGLRAALRAVITDYDDVPTDLYLIEAERIFRAALATAPERAVLDVERLARALQHSNHGTRWRDQYGAALTFDELGDEQRLQVREAADNIAAAYHGEQPEADLFPPEGCSCQGFPGSGYPHRDWCTELREQAYASERAEYRRAHP